MEIRIEKTDYGPKSEGRSPSRKQSEFEVTFDDSFCSIDAPLTRKQLERFCKQLCKLLVRTDRPRYTVHNRSSISVSLHAVDREEAPDR
jgi:hypothetical protein